jgi:hypothetical protein
MKATVRFWGLFCLFTPFLAHAQDFTGTYVSKSQERNSGKRNSGGKEFGGH